MVFSMKSSNEWIEDIERKLKERYDKRNNRRKIAFNCIGWFASCSFILMAVLALPKNIMLNPNEKVNIENNITSSKEAVIDYSETNSTMTQEESSSQFHKTEHNDKSSEIDVTTEHNDIIINDTTATPTISEQDNDVNPSDIYPNGTTSDFPSNPSDINPENTQSPDNQEKPTQSSIVEPTKPAEKDFYINRIIGTSPAVSTGSCQLSETLFWSHQQMLDYYGIDLDSLNSKVFCNSDYSADIHDEYVVKVYEDGNLESDLFEISYQDSFGKCVTISVSKVSYPYKVIYDLESNNASNICGNSIIVGGMSLSGTDTIDFYYADFQKNDVNYRLIGEYMSDIEFLEIVGNLLNL